jgi:uncharacterized protein Smg (DUF494 family)
MLKHKRGKPMKSDQKQMILHSFNTLSGNELGFVDIVVFVCLFVCASKSTQRAHEEMTGEGFFYMVLSA